MARRFAATEDDARDLAQDALMIALDRGFDDWSSRSRRPWLHGVLRKHAAYVARTKTRERRRERAEVHVVAPKPAAWIWRPDFIASLPRSLRAVAMLANADLCAAEIRWLLQLNPTALRSRLAALRRAVRAESESATLPAPDPQMSLGMRRAPLLAGLKRLRGRAVVTHDPDGHVILFREVAHKIRGSGNR
jgi:DNA-directed RNA polymerase specialized sigma24 family protein